jgi:hypothetical protein
MTGAIANVCGVQKVVASWIGTGAMSFQSGVCIFLLGLVQLFKQNQHK